MPLLRAVSKTEPCTWLVPARVVRMTVPGRFIEAEQTGQIRSGFETGRGQIDQILDLASVDGQLFDALALHHGSQRGRGGGDQRRDIAGDVDLGNRAAHADGRADLGSLADL